jgi:hypothetical protein
MSDASALKAQDDIDLCDLRHIQHGDWKYKVDTVWNYSEKMVVLKASVNLQRELYIRAKYNDETKQNYPYAFFTNCTLTSEIKILRKHTFNVGTHASTQERCRYTPWQHHALSMY